MLYKLEREQPIKAPIAQVWDFFSDPRNLNDLTPPDLQFRIVTQNPGKMFNGQIIEYRIKIAPLLWRSWVTEIKNVVERVSFVDEQRFGPYRFWYHRHSFIDCGDFVLVGDHVVYALPLGPLGQIVNALVVKQKLNAIFDYRTRKLKELFSTSDGTSE